MRGLAVAAATTALFASTVVADVDPIVIKGSKFFYKSNGTQFFMKGVAYQQDYSNDGAGSSTAGNGKYTDPLSDEGNCKRDIPELQKLHTNTIRVYAIDPTKNHDACMSMLADAGIYVVADLSAPVEGQSINRESPSWDDALFTRYTSVVNAMKGYKNTLGFFAGNEVSNNSTNTDAIAFVKAAVRDTKAYIADNSDRPIGVGYATSDDTDILMNVADYLNCGQDAKNTIDFLGYNIYSWCGDATFSSSNYEKHTKDFSTYSVPVFFAEYGCNDVEPRTWGDTAALFSDKMTGVWSGGIVYQYFQSTNKYGLVTVDGDSVTELTDFKNLATAIAKVSPSGVSMSSYSPSNSPQKCPAVGDNNWAASSATLPPAPNDDLCSCMYQSLSCVVSSKTDVKDYGTLFGQACGTSGVCDGIAHNASMGTYGDYSMCNSTVQLSFVFDQYYQAQKKDSQACNFDGAANTRSPSSSSGSCSKLLDQAGPHGTGSVSLSAQPGTNTGNVGSGGSGSSGSGGSGGSSHSPSKGAAADMNVPRAESGLGLMIGVITLSVLSGIGMIAL